MSRIVDPNLFQSIDSNNTKVITSADASPGSPWVGVASRTRSQGVVGIFLSAISTAQIAGTYTFEFGEDGVTFPVSIGLHSDDFTTIRFRPLMNKGEFYRAQFEPDTAMGATVVILESQFAKQADPPFVVPAGHVFEESEAAFGAQFSFIKAFGDDGLSKNVRATALGDLRVSDERLSITESGSLDTESIRDDISLSFSRDSGAAAIANDLTDNSSGGGVAHDATNGRAVFTTTSTAGRSAYFESVGHAEYEAGHMIRGEMTVEVSPALAGTAKVEWGFGEDDGLNDVLNGIGWGMDVTGLYVWRKKAGAYASKVYQTAFNKDLLDGVEPTRFRTSSAAVALDTTKNTLYSMGFEWLGVAPPFYRVQAPLGEFVTAHIENTSNRINSTTIPEPELPLFVRVANGNQATDYTVSCGSWRGGIYTSKTTLIAQRQDKSYVAKGASSTSDINSSTVNIPTGAGNGFIGSGYMDLETLAGFYISFLSDQVCTIYVDNSIDGVTVDRTSTFNSVANVHFSKQLTKITRYAKVRVDNAGSGTTTTFRLQTGVVDTAANPSTGRLDEPLSDGAIAQNTHATISAREPGGVVHSNIGKGLLGGLDVGIVEHEVGTPILKYDSVSGGCNNSIGGTSVQIATSPPAGVQAVLLQSDPDNGNVVLYISDASATATNGGAMHALGTAGSVVFPVGGGQTYWTRASTGSGKTIRWTWLRRTTPA